VTKPQVALPSLIRGLYKRVADKLGIDQSYVSRVARGERRSPKIEAILAREYLRILAALAKSTKKRADG
jgi:transcriptional regulator with XRE-family HTH domain